MVPILLSLSFLLIAAPGCASGGVKPAAANGGGTWGPDTNTSKGTPSPAALVHYGEFSFPAELAGLRRGRRTVFKDKRLGISIPYFGRSPVMVASLYVYNRGASGIVDGHRSATARSAFTSARQAIQKAVDRGTYAEARLIHRDVLGLSQDANRKFLRAVYLIRYADRPGVRESHLLVTGSRGYLWKVRCTFSASSRTRKSARRALLIWLRAVMDYQDGI